MSYLAIENDIKTGTVDRAAPILLYGEEGFLISHYEKQLTALFSGSENAEGSLDISVFYMDEADDEAIMATLDTFPMLSPYRVVVVKSHPGFSGQKSESDEGAGKKNRLAGYIAGIPETARLVFVSNNINKTRALYKAVAKHGAVYEFNHLDEGALRKFALKRFKAMGANITHDVLDAFIFGTGYLEKDTDRDLFTVENDTYKLASFVLADGRNVIEHSDIEECMPGVLRTDVFAMLDAISSGNKAQAVRLLENSLAGGESVFRLLSLFVGHFEIMLGYKELSAAGHSDGKITQILGERSDWRVRKLGGYAGRFDAAKLKWIVGRLYDVERNIKSGDMPERLALTVLLAKI